MLVNQYHFDFFSLDGYTHLGQLPPVFSAQRVRFGVTHLQVAASAELRHDKALSHRQQIHSDYTLKDFKQFIYQKVHFTSIISSFLFPVLCRVFSLIWFLKSTARIGLESCVLTWNPAGMRH